MPQGIRHQGAGDPAGAGAHRQVPPAARHGLAGDPAGAGDGHDRRVLKTRSESWEETDDAGRALRRTMGIASLGGATLDIEENYLMKKLYTALGAIQIENQARI